MATDQPTFTAGPSGIETPGRLKRETTWFAAPAALLVAGTGLLGLSDGGLTLGLPAWLLLAAGVLGLLRALLLAPRDTAARKPGALHHFTETVKRSRLLF